jgi:ABC-type lipoprotein export system ATPase subunit
VSDGSEILARCDRVARTFGSGRAAVVAVSGVTCEVHDGDHIALMGPSGSGKSTLLHLVAGLDEPTRGLLTWPAIGSRDQLRPGPVGVVFQSPSLLPPLDVLENVTLPLLLAGESPDVARRKGQGALERLDLGSLAAKLPEEISGGQAQRVAVARVLAGRPRLILADEPTGQLDHVVGALVIGALIDAAVASGAALVISTHDPRIGDRLETVWQMRDGLLDRDIGVACSA